MHRRTLTQPNNDVKLNIFFYQQTSCGKPFRGEKIIIFFSKIVNRKSAKCECISSYFHFWDSESFAIVANCIMFVFKVVLLCKLMVENFDIGVALDEFGNLKEVLSALVLKI